LGAEREREREREREIKEEEKKKRKEKKRKDGSSSMIEFSLLLEPYTLGQLTLLVFPLAASPL